MNVCLGWAHYGNGTLLKITGLPKTQKVSRINIYNNITAPNNFQTKPEINSLKYSILVSTRLTNQNSPSQVDKTTKDSGNRHGMVPYGDTEIFDISDGTYSIAH